jgi:L-seryl-tRNA(Ser) seleniumtransferase
VYRALPAVHQLLDHPLLRDALSSSGREAVLIACRTALDELRHRIADEELESGEVEAACADLPERVLHWLDASTAPAYPDLINASGVLIHTNLGRAPLPHPSSRVFGSYLALEYDLVRGTRGQRLAPLGSRIARVCGAEWAVMVNNNAAALLLLLTAHAQGREVIVSRGQLIEIGGSFRLPEVMAASGARLVEVGCTNRTHLRDYQYAIGDNTAAILVAHPSNYRIVGFTTEPPLEELVDLSHRHGLPMIVDQGTGSLHDLEPWGFADEPSVQSLLATGADMVCFSGDKLLGGPQAGIVVGSRRWVEPLGRHPMYRALRPDKIALVLMDEVLRAHDSGRLAEIPLYAMLTTPLETLKRRARTLGRRLRASGVPVSGRATRSVLGGGTTPTQSMPSYGLAIAADQRLGDALRQTTPPVVGRIEDEVLILDLRTVFPSQDRQLETCLREAYQAYRGD